MQEEIEKIAGVEEVEINGARTEQTEIIISPTLFEDYGLTPAAVVSQVINANASIGVPRLTGDVGETTLVVDSGLDTLADVYDITLLPPMMPKSVWAMWQKSSAHLKRPILWPKSTASPPSPWM